VMRQNLLFALLVTIAGFSAVPQLVAQPHPAGRVKTSTSIEVKMIKAGEVSVPAEFQVALYENLLQEIETKGGFQAVYRDGDRSAKNNSNLVLMDATITGFQEGSEMARQVTTVKGATKIVVHCQFTDTKGTILLQRDVEGKVRFFGDNLKATQDFAKKAAGVADDALSAYRTNPEYRSAAQQQSPSVALP